MRWTTEPSRGAWRARGSYGAIAFGVLLALTVPVVATRRPPVPQPVAFNHGKHTQDLGMACEFCHVYVRAAAHAGLPDAGVCSMCHRTMVGESTEAERVTELLGQGDPLRFNKLFRLPQHVYYTHRRHVGIADLACTHCHGDIAETDRPPDRPLIRITMDFCIDCHRQGGVSEDCNACHR